MLQVAICVGVAVIASALMAGAILSAFEPPADQDRGFTDDLGVSLLARKSS